MLKPQYPTILGLMLLIGVLPTYSQAQDAPTDYEDLKAQLAERNAVIIELQRSVADLQDQLAVLESQLQNKSTGKDEIPPLRRDDSPRQTSRRSDTGRLIVDEVAAERALERTLVQAGVLLLPRGALELTPSLSMAVSDFELATIVDVGAGDELGIVRVDRSSYSLALTGRIGLPFDSQLEFSIPYLSVTEDSALSVLSGSTDAISQTGRGTGDFVVGVSKTLWRESAHTPDVVGRIVWNAGNGSEDDDGVVLGGGFSSLTGSLSFMKRLDPLALILSLDYEDSRSNGEITPGDAFGVSFGVGLAVSPSSSLFGSVTHRSVSEAKIAGEPVANSDLDISSVTLGFSTILRRGTLLNLYTEIGMSDDAPDYAIGFSVPMRVR